MAERLKIRPQSLDAVILIAENYKKQVSFYKNTLGLEVDAEYSDATFFAIGKQKLAIFAKSHHPEGTERLNGAGHGISHLEFGLSKENAERVIKQLTNANAATDDDNFEDADGNLFILILGKADSTHEVRIIDYQ